MLRGCASLFASISKENHAYYSVDGEAPSDGPLVTAGVPSGSRTVSEQTLAELRELHRDGEKATTVGLGEVRGEVFASEQDLNMIELFYIYTEREGESFSIAQR